MTTEAPVWVKQLNLVKNLPQPEFRYVGLPNQTIEGFVKSGGVAEAIDILGKTYIPQYDPKQYEEFVSAYEWIRSSEEQAVQEPQFVLNHLFKLSVLGDIIEDLLNDKTKLTEMARKRLVTYTQTSPDFITDIKAVTWPAFNRMKRNFVELTATRGGKPYDIHNGVSSTFLLNTAEEFYFSGGTYKRELASDLIIGQMLQTYWLKLRTRAIAG